MRIRTPFAAVLLMSLVVCSPTARAEVEDTPIAKFDDPDAKSTATGSASRVVLEAGDADAKATARLAKLWGMSPGYYGRYAFTVSAPFDSKKADKVDVGTLSGLTAGTTATLEVSTLRWSKASDDEQAAITQACEAVIPKLIPGYEWRQVGRLTDLNCNKDLLDKKALEAAVKKINAQAETCAKCRKVQDAEPPLCELIRDTRQRACATAAPADRTTTAMCGLLTVEERRECAACEEWGPLENAVCDQVRGKATLAANVDQILKEVDAELTARINDAFRPMQGLTLSVKANQQDFSYVLADVPTTTEKSSERGYAASLAFTQVGRTHLWTLGYAHEESYKVADKVQVCSPIGTTGSSSCTEASIGTPEKETAELAFVESRWIITAERFALAPRIEYDFKESNWAVRVPLYFVVNKEKEFTAGMALGYSEAEEEDEEFGASVFISKAFAFFD